MKLHSVLLGLCIVFAPLAGAADQGDLYVYPAKGQSVDQTERDRYDCYLWARDQAGYDPSTDASASTPNLVRVPVGRNPNQGATLVGTIVGAIAGAAIGGHGHDAGTGAVLGAAAGTVVGAGVEQSGQQRVEDQARQQADRMAAEEARDAEGRSNYRRAFSACLEGRGYVVR